MGGQLFGGSVQHAVVCINFTCRHPRTPIFHIVQIIELWIQKKSLNKFANVDCTPTSHPNWKPACGGNSLILAMNCPVLIQKKEKRCEIVNPELYYLNNWSEAPIPIFIPIESGFWKRVRKWSLRSPSICSRRKRIQSVPVLLHIMAAKLKLICSAIFLGKKNTEKWIRKIIKKTIKNGSPLFSLVEKLSHL